MNHSNIHDYQIDQLIKLLERGDIFQIVTRKKLRDVIFGSNDKIDTSQIILYKDSILHTGNILIINCPKKS